VGHGGFDPATQEGLLAMVDENGNSFRISATQLGRLLADHKTLRLAVLNSCEGAKGSDTNIFSSTASILMRRGVPAVVAMQYEITDRAAIEFSQVFYEDIAHGLAVDTAVTEARKAISMSLGSSLEWGTPVLYMRAPDGVLFDIRGTPRPAPQVAAVPERPLPPPPPAPEPVAAPAGPTGSAGPPEAGPVRSGGGGAGTPPPSSPPPSPPAGWKDRLRRNPILVGVGGGVAAFVGLIWLVMTLGGEPSEGWDESAGASAEVTAQQETLFVELSEGFLPDPHVVSLTAGGPFEYSQECVTGNFSGEDNPSLDLRYNGNGRETLYLYVAAQGATTMSVLPPDQSGYLCEDASSGEGNPLLEIPNAPSGLYRIWVGTIGPQPLQATFFISEVHPESIGVLSEESRVVTLTMGFEPDPYVVDNLTAGGPIRFWSDEGCAEERWRTSEPTVVLRYDRTLPWTLHFYTGGGGPKGLRIMHPDGTTFCEREVDQDGNPGLFIGDAPTGEYRIWLVTRGGQEPLPSRLYISHYYLLPE